MSTSEENRHCMANCIERKRRTATCQEKTRWEGPVKVEARHHKESDKESPDIGSVHTETQKPCCPGVEGQFYKRQSACFL